VRTWIKFAAACVLMAAPASGLFAQSKLAVSSMNLHQYEDGPVLAASYEFLPGETAWFGCRMSGFKIETKDEDRFVKLSWDVTVTDAVGVLIEKPRSGRIEDQLQPEDKNWQPKFLASFQVPPFAIGGVYKIQVTVEDELAGTQAARTLEFAVRAPAFRPADTLVVRNFRFLAKEDEDGVPLRPAVYRQGGMLWARFDIAGHKLGENNRFDVSYGLAVLGPDGKQLFAQPEAAGEAKESFYPQRWVPGVLSLSLDANVAKAAYTLVVTVRDKLADQTAELREAFQVE
jgi:hypothetical protein